MKFFAVLILLIGFAVIATADSTINPASCRTGQVRGFAAVTGEPRLGGAGAIPNYFTKSPQYFGIRYNCSRQLVYVKRADEGLYDVRFPGNPARVAIVSAISDQAIATSVYRPDGSSFRISLRGPLVEQGLLVRRDAEFYITIF